MNVESQCPYCGEPLELSVDELGGRRQSYVEDCVVCCRPIQVEVVVDQGDVDVTLRGQDD
jgi:Cysteine-rich CPXCG